MQKRRFSVTPRREEDHRLILQTAFDTYCQTGSWPDSQRLLRKLVLKIEDEEALYYLGYPWLRGTALNNGPVELTVKGLSICHGAEPILEAFVRAIRFGVERYLDDTLEKPTVRLADLTDHLGIAPEQASQVFRLMTKEGLFREFSGSLQEDMVASLQELGRFRHVKTLEDYLQRRYRDDPDSMPLGGKEVYGGHEEPQAVLGKSAYTPDTAFVMMWLGTDNPDREEVAAVVRECFAAHGVRAVRAIDIEHEGSITEVILQQISDCEFLFADLTGERPSVYYEIGFAHALRKRPILYRRKGTRIHFDLAVHNAPEYESPEDLRAKLSRRLEDRIGPPRVRLHPLPPPS